MKSAPTQGVRAQDQVVADGELGEDPAALRHERDSCTQHRLGWMTVHGPAVDGDAPG